MEKNKMEKISLKTEEEVIPHLKDILAECSNGGDLQQIEHNVFEIATHLGIKSEELSN